MDISETADTYKKLRETALRRRPSDLGLNRIPGRPVWGVVMETGYAQGVSTLVVTDDGAVSLFTSGGGETIHLTESDWPHQTGTRFLDAAIDFLNASVPAWAYPLPDIGQVRFYLLAFDGVMTVEAVEGELAAGRAPLSGLFYAGHDVLTLARLMSEAADEGADEGAEWAAYDGESEPPETKAIAPVEPTEVEAPLNEEAPTEVEESPAELPKEEPLEEEAPAEEEPPTEEEPPVEPPEIEPPPVEAPKAETQAPPEPPIAERPTLDAMRSDAIAVESPKIEPSLADVSPVEPPPVEPSVPAPPIEPPPVEPPVAAPPVEPPPIEPPPVEEPPAPAPPVAAPAPRRDPLLKAAAANDANAVTRLLKEGSDPAGDATGRTPLMAAAHVGALEPLRLLLAAGAPVEAKESHGFTALMIACNAGRVDCVNLLLEAGADVHAADGEGSTPLMFAAQRGNDDLVRLLMEHGADPTATGTHGLTAIGFARRHGFSKTVDILRGKDS